MGFSVSILVCPHLVCLLRSTLSPFMNRSTGCRFSITWSGVYGVILRTPVIRNAANSFVFVRLRTLVFFSIATHHIMAANLECVDFPPHFLSRKVLESRMLSRYFVCFFEISKVGPLSLEAFVILYFFCEVGKGVFP